MAEATSPPSSVKEDNYVVPQIIGVWGGGLIGMSTAVHFARKGIKSIVYDINPEQVDRINNAKFLVGFEDWVGFRVKDYISNGLVTATTDIGDMHNQGITTHFVAVPTERGGEPYMGIIKTVLQQIKDLDPELCIIESTVVPGQTEALARCFGLVDHLGVATRRDWFTASENNLANCVRVYCGVNDAVSRRMEAVLGVVCKELVRGSCCTVVEMTKCLDNGIFHTVAMYASQLAVGYPGENSAEALELAATHWRLGNHVYFPSIGTGGHCVPLANKYLIAGAEEPKRLAIAGEAIKYDASAPIAIADALTSRLLKPGDKVAVLGICYRGDISLHLGSPHVKFARKLVSLGVSVGVHDPYYTPAELYDIIGEDITPLNFPDDLMNYDYIYVGAADSIYAKKIYSVLAYMRSGQRILDNQGVWEALADDAHDLDITYHRVGSPGWFSFPPTRNLTTTPPPPPPEEDPAVVYMTKWFQIRKIPDPRSTTPNPYFVLERPNSVTIICYSLVSSKFLLQKQYRAHIDREAWEFPMGGIDEGESALAAATRELLEETGLSITPSNMKRLGEYYPIPGLSTQRSHIFLAYVSEEQLNTARPAIYEGISAFKVVDRDEFNAMVKRGGIIDGYTLAAFSIWESSTFRISSFFEEGKDAMPIDWQLAEAMNSRLPGFNEECMSRQHI